MPRPRSEWLGIPVLRVRWDGRGVRSRRGEVARVQQAVGLVRQDHQGEGNEGG